MTRRSRGGDDVVRAIERVYRARFHAFVRAATAIVGDSDAAYDVVQEAFADAVRNRGDLRGDAEPWLWRIVINGARDHRRARRAAALGAPPAGGNGYDAAAAERVVRESLLELPERQRLVVFLRYYAELDYAAIARLLGVTSGTVGATLNAARATLRERLEDLR